jgi:gliding motility-associated-like protein
MDKCGGIYDTTFIWVAPTLTISTDTISTWIGGRNIRCFGENNGFIKLIPRGGIEAFSQFNEYNLDYNWSNAARTKDISGLTSGSYSVTVSDRFLCIDTTSFLLTQPDRLISQFVIVDTLSCLGADGILAVVTTGGTTGYSQYWWPWEAYGIPPGYYADTLYNIVPGIYSVKTNDPNLCTDSLGIFIQEPSTVSVNIVSLPYGGGFQLKCFGDSSGRMRTTTDYTGNLLYEWTGPGGFDTTFVSNSPIISYTGLVAGKYTLKYTDEIGCSVDANEINLRQPNPLNIVQSTVSAPNPRYNVSCFNADDGTITLNQITGGHAYGGYFYQWSVLEGDGTVDPAIRNQTGLKAGRYEVEVTDNQACATGDTFELLQPLPILIAVDTPSAPAGSTNLKCFGDDDGYIQLSVTGGDVVEAPYRYDWSHGPQTALLNNLSAGIYKVTVTDGINCSVIDTIVLTQPAQLKVDSLVISSYNGYEIQCADSTNGKVELFVSGGVIDYVFNWTRDGNPFGGDTNRFENISPGLYAARITDANNCYLDWSRNLRSPEPLELIIETTTIDCTGDVKGTAHAIVTGGIDPYDYNWLNGQTTALITGLDTGLYALLVTDLNGCPIADSVIIAQDPTVEFTFVMSKEISCYQGNDGILSLNITSPVEPASYLWSDGSTGESLNGIGEGNYSVTVVDLNGCKNTESVLISDPEEIFPRVLVLDALCYESADGEAELDAIGGSGEYSFEWNGGLVTGEKVGNLIAGDYGLRVIDSRECTKDTFIRVGQPGRIIIALDEQNTVLPFCPDWKNGTLAITVSGGTPDYDYIWQLYPGVNDSVLSEVKEGYYAVRVTDQHNCYADTTLKLESQQFTCLNIPTAFTPNNDGANDFWEVSYINDEHGEAPFYEVYPEGSMKIFDRWGTLVFMCENGCHDLWWGQDLKGRDLPSDSYHFIIELNTGDSRPPLKGAVTIIR